MSKHKFQLAETIGVPEHDLAAMCHFDDSGKKFRPWPTLRVSYDPGTARDMVMQTLAEAKEEGCLGLDLEFTGKRATILGIASRRSAAGVPYNHELAAECLDSGLPLAGHAVSDADKPVLDSMFDRDIPLRRFQDTMLKGYLCNQDWCSMPGKDQDDDDPGALGLMNLYTMASYYLGVPQWKLCRGEMCFGPCPKHRPFHYCAVDSWTGLEGNYRLDEDLARKNIPFKFYEELQDLTVYCSKMTERGVKIDLDLVRSLEKDFETRKQTIFPNEKIGKKTEFGTWSAPDEWGEIIWTPAPFNPRAPKAAAQFFEDQGIILRDRGGKASVNKAIIQKALDKQLKGLGCEYDPKKHVLVNPAGEELDPEERLSPTLNLLVKLAQYKGSGKGLSSWFKDDYITNGYAHPRFIVTGTSTGRLSSSGPNFQNIPRVGFGSLVRRVIIPRDPGLCLVKADYSQLELRVCLWYAGQISGKLEMPQGDAFKWLVNESGGKFDAAANRLGLSARDIAKSVSHAGDYLEGLVVLTESELASKRRQEEISAGALLAFDGRCGRPLWFYRGGYVCFTGANLAERLFGARTYENRAKALGIQEIYFSRFESIRRWHQSLSEFIDKHGYIQSHTQGRYLALYGTPEEDLKLAAAFLGQGGGADIAQEAMLRYAALGDIATVQVHDELLFEKPRDWSDEQCLKHMSLMSLSSARFPGLSCPTKTYRGLRWRERTKDKKTGEWNSPDDELMEIVSS